MHNALTAHENVGSELVMGEKLRDLEHPDDAMCLFDTAEIAQLSLIRLARAFALFGKCSATSICEVMS